MSLLEVNKITPQSGTTLTLGDSGDTINFGSGVLPNFENLTVTGDLTVDTNSLKVDSANNRVGIGTASPDRPLKIISTSSSPIIEIQGSKGSGFEFGFGIDSNGGFLQQNGNTNLRAFVNGSERVRVTNSGDFLVGMTSPSVNNTGFYALSAGGSSATRASGTPLNVNRQTDNGTIISLRKDGTEIGIVGVVSNDNLYITNPHTNTQKGIGIADDNLYPVDSDGNSSSNVLDIGDSSAQFRNAYFGGTVNATRIESGVNSNFDDALKVTSTGGFGFTQGDIRISSATTDGPSGRGQGIFMFNEGYDRTFYAGTLYGNQAYGIGSVSNTGLDTSAANATNSYVEFYSTSTGTVFNERSVDRDFRIESNNNSHMLFVDAGNDRVGIDTSSPEGIFDAYGTGYFGVQNYSEQATQLAFVLRGDGVSGVYAPSRFNFYTQPGTTSNGVAKIHIKSKYGSDAESSELFTFTSNGRLGLGTSTPSSQLHILGSSTTSQVIIENTDGGAAAAPDLFLYRNSATPADDDVLGNIEFRGKNSTGGETRYVINNTKIVDASAGTEDGQTEWQLLNNGSFQKILTLHPNQVVINEDSLDTDFRVESDNLSDALKVDGANGHVKFYVTRQVPQYAGTFPGATPSTVVDLSSLGTTTNAGVRIRAHGSENSYRNSSYGEWIAVRSLAGGTDHWDLISVAQVVTGNNYGQVVLSMSGSNLQVKNGANAATGSYRISFELFN